LNRARKKETALVTGASRGIGRAIALGLAQKGADVAVNYRKNAEAAKQVVEEIERLGRKAVAIKADVTSFEKTKNMVDQILDRFASLDIVVNNAGVAIAKTLLKLTEDEWDRVMAVNLKGTFTVCKHVVPIMIKQGHGKIINISSGIALTGYHGYTAYSAAKAGIISFSKSLAKEVGKAGINVNVVAPGFIATELQDGISKEQRERHLSTIALGRFGTPQEVAETVVFLSLGGDFITGEVIFVNGGRC
jgi:3-oxoacyl-[acyl-carrier protein] reductase